MFYWNTQRISGWSIFHHNLLPHEWLHNKDIFFTKIFNEINFNTYIYYEFYFIYKSLTAFCNIISLDTNTDQWPLMIKKKIQCFKIPRWKQLLTGSATRGQTYLPSLAKTNNSQQKIYLSTINCVNKTTDYIVRPETAYNKSHRSQPAKQTGIM